MARAPLWRVASCAGAMTHQLGALGGGCLSLFQGGLLVAFPGGRGSATIREARSRSLPLSRGRSGEIGAGAAFRCFSMGCRRKRARMTRGTCAHDWRSRGPGSLSVEDARHGRIGQGLRRAEHAPAVAFVVRPTAATICQPPKCPPIQPPTYRAPLPALIRSASRPL